MFGPKYKTLSEFDLVINFLVTLPAIERLHLALKSLNNS